MESIAHWYSVYSAWIAVPLIAVIAIYFHFKNKTTPTLVLAIGFSLVAIGAILQIFVGAGSASFDEIGNMLSSSGPPMSWYLGSIITSTGLLITLVGFSLVAFKLKCSEK